MIFKLFEDFNKKIVYRGIKRNFNSEYNDIEYYAEDINYARVFGDNIKMFLINDDQDVMDLDIFNEKLSKETRESDKYLFTIHSTYMNKESENYAYRGLRDILLLDSDMDTFINFQREFMNAKIIKGRDSGNESKIVYAVRDKSLIKEIK